MWHRGSLRVWKGHICYQGNVFSGAGLVRGLGSFLSLAWCERAYNSWARACSSVGKAVFILREKQSLISGWWTEECQGLCLNSSESARSSFNGKLCLYCTCCYIDVVAEKGHSESQWLLKESLNLISISLLALMWLLPVSTVQLRAMLQIPQVLGTNRRKLGLDGALCSGSQQHWLHHLQRCPLSAQGAGHPQHAWCSPREEAAPELPRSLLQS